MKGFVEADFGDLIQFGTTGGERCDLRRMRLDFVVHWARAGGLVLPVRPGSKEGYRRWRRLATADVSIIAKWCAIYPECNFGLVMGEGFVCLDVDVRNGKPGPESLTELLAKFPLSLDDTFSVKTPSGGRHYYLRTNRCYRTKNGASPGIDFRARGSYILSPYSELFGEGHYIPVGPIERILELPEDLGNFLSKPLPDPSNALLATLQGAKAIDWTPHALSSEPLERSERALIDHWLRSIDPSLPYHAWYRTIFALLNLWPTQETVALLESWSRQSHRWDAAEFRKKVASYDPNYPEKLGRRFILQVIDDFPCKTVPAPLTCKEIDDAHLRRLVDSHVEAAVHLLKEYGNTPTPEHAAALRTIGETMIRALYSQTSFRRAFPLETGMGKTTLVKALCVVLTKQELDKGILITCEQIKQLGELRGDLLALGVPRERIGVVHSSADEKEIPSIERGSAPHYQILLACHNGVRTEKGRRADPADLMEYITRKGTLGRRDLVIWDESLIDAKAYHISKTDLLDSIAICLDRYETALAEGFKPTADWVYVYGGLRGLLEEARVALRATADGLVELPVPHASPTQIRQAIGNLLARRGARDVEDHERRLSQFLEFLQRGTVRVVPLRGDKTMIQFEQTIDDCFDKIVILDASCHIRELAKYDRKLEIHRLPITKRYANVEIRWVDAKSSKSSFRNDGGRAHFAAYSEYLLSLVERDYPRGDEGIVYYHKENDVPVRAVLKTAAEMRGLGSKTIHALHWGLHRASNQYRNAKWTFFWGVQYLPEGAIAGLIAGQMGQADHVFLRNEIDDVRNSEVAESLYQAISRGHSRLTINGEVGQQVVDLLIPKTQWEQIWPLLQRVMPGVKSTQVESLQFPERVRKNAASYVELANSILRFLEELPEEWAEITIGAVKSELQIDVDSNSSLWRRAQREIDMQLRAWRRRGKTFVRASM